MPKRNKVTIVGAGNVGATTAHIIASKELADVVLVDIVEDMPQGKALDIMESTSIDGVDCTITGSNNYKPISDSDIVVVTSGVSRKPGMDRAELLSINQTIVNSVCNEIKQNCPHAIVILVSNPLDAMCHVAYNTLNFESHRVIGMAGVLDTARYKTFVAMETGCSIKDVHGIVLGGHGDTMVPLPNHTSVGGIPLIELISQTRIDAIIERTAKGGAEIVTLLKTGSAYYAPAASITAMVESILKDQKRVLPCAALLNGEYGHTGLYLGVPCVLGKDGVDKIIEMSLSNKEKALLKHSADAVSTLVTQLGLS